MLASAQPNRGKHMQIAIRTLAFAAVLAAVPSFASAEGLLTQKNVSFALADAAAHAALAKCESMGFKVSAAVVDRGGAIIVMLHGDGAGLHTPEGAERKAYTARTFGAPSADFVKRMKDRPETAGSIQYQRVLALPGGL